MEPTTTAFTIASNNYLGMARVFGESYLEQHPGSRVFVCLVDEPDARIPYDELPFEIVTARELGIPDFASFAFKYDVLELNTAVKPFFFKYLRNQLGLDRAFYFDPDILVHDRLVGLERALVDHQAVLTPHLTRPIGNRRRPQERIIGVCGVYNLGFIGLRLDQTTSSFLDWWCDRLSRYCVVDVQRGLFVDQSWMNFAPAYLSSVAIVRDPIFNVAYWNLPQRHPVLVEDYWEIDGERVGFFHFSGIDFDDLDSISRHQNRIDLEKRPELRPLFEHYRDLVLASGHRKYKGIPYHYGFFSETEIPIPWFARIMLQEVDPRGRRWSDPFAPDGADSFLSWLTAPFDLDGVPVHRASLYLWKLRPDIRREFSNLAGAEVRRYIDWYLDHGAESAGLHNVFVDSLRCLVAPALERDLEVERISNLDLRFPGDAMSWLNEEIGGTQRPTLTRLVMAIYRTREDLMASYPDPLAGDRRGLAYWFATRGPLEYAMHPDLVRPVWQTLSTKSRVIHGLRSFVAPKGDHEPSPKLVWEATDTTPLPENVCRQFSAVRDDPGATRPSLSGVNLVGYHEGSAPRSSLVATLVPGLESVGLECSVIVLDDLQPDSEARFDVAREIGAPFPITILAVPPEDWQWCLELLPLASRSGAPVVGLWSNASAAPSSSQTRSISEIWISESHEGVIIDPDWNVDVRRLPFPCDALTVVFPSAGANGSARHAERLGSGRPCPAEGEARRPEIARSWKSAIESALEAYSAVAGGIGRRR